MSAPTDIRQHILDVAYPLFVQRGFTAVGLTEVLSAAKVPKGSFYHYFGSKEAFGEAVIDAYFAGYFAHVDAIFARPGTAGHRLVAYFRDWLDSQIGDAPARCLVVKLGAEVCDLSESMRAALKRGTRGAIERIARCIDAGRSDGSLTAPADASALAATLYQNWLGASLLAKITRDRAPLDAALANTKLALAIAR